MAFDVRVPGHTIVQWAHDVLVAMGIDNPPVASIQALITWANHESGVYNPNVAGGLNNPLNTTEKHFGASGQGGSQGNISDFGSYDQGIRNIAWNLTQTKGVGYEAIVAALRTGDTNGIYSAVNASHFGTHNLGPGGSAPQGYSGSTGSAGPGVAGTNPVGATTPLPKFNLPSGGTLYAVDGTFVVVYKVGNDNVYYDFSTPGVGSRVNTSGTPSGRALTHDQFYNLPNLIHAGVVDELAGRDLQTGQSYQTWLHNQLLILSGGNQEMMNDPQVVSIMVQGAAHQWSADEIQAKLKLTTYWKTHDDTQRNWMTLSPAEQQQRVNTTTGQLRDAYFAATGVQIDPNDKALKQWALQIASGAKTITDATWQWLRPTAAKNPQSPWSRQLEQEKEAQRQQGVDIGNMAQTVHDRADAMGIKMSPQTQHQWADWLVTKQKSDGDLTNLLVQQATVLYPWAKTQLATGMTVKDIAQPWTDTYNRVMETSSDLFNPRVQKALTQAQPVYDFEKDLKSTPEWLQTTNAHDTLTSAAATVGQKMGFIQ